jgi:hypothetical protein
VSVTAESSEGLFLDLEVYNITDLLSYYSYQSELSAALFPYLLEQFSLEGTQYDEVTINEYSINDSPLSITVINIDEILYDSNVVDCLQSVMTQKSEALITDIRADLSKIINTKTNECLANVDSYLDWYFDWLADDLLIKAWRGLKSLVSDYNEGVELIKNYQAHFYPFFEMGNDIQHCLLRYNSVIQNLALSYIMVLEQSQIDPSVSFQIQQNMEGNDFMKPFQPTSDYIRSFISDHNALAELSFIDADGIKSLNFVRIAVNAGADKGLDVIATTIGTAIGGPPGAVIGFGVGIIGGFIANAVTSKAVREAKYNEYRTAIVNSFEKNRRDLHTALR